MNQVFCSAKLVEDYARRKKKNPGFSLRAYAKFLNLQAPTLSAVLKNKRPLPGKAAEQVATRLGLRGLEKKQFLESAYFRGEAKEILATLKTPKEILDSELHYKIIAEPEYYAIFSLLELKNAKHDPYWIAQRLGCSVGKIQTALEGLLKSGLLTKEGNKFKKKPIRLSTTEDVQSRALRDSHRAALKQAAESLDAVDVSLRDLSSIYFPANLKRLPEAKKLIRDFRKQLAALFQEDENDEVYVLNTQLFPLTKLSRGKL